MTKLLYLALIATTAGCLGTDDTSEPEEGQVESESVSLPGQGSIGQGSTMQGSTMQGSTMQGSTMQGSTMQGSTMQGSTMQGGSTGTMAAQYGEIRGTALVFWTKSSPKSTTWEQRFPDKICYWNSKRTISSGCTKYAVGVPIVGSTWPTTFRRVEADGSVTQIPVTLRLEAVRKDTTTAMHRLNGSAYATGSVVPRGTNGCENPFGCRVNSDIYNYDLRAINVVDANGQNPYLCPSGQTAIALSGTWDSTGTYVPSTTQFTFACTNGVIAKCTRWGYRHYDRAIKDNGGTAAESLAAYHQTCIRAAMADYCGSAKSMTKDGTLVDIYDYASWNDSGYVPKLRGLVYDWYSINAFSWEADYDRYGSTRIDYQRYAELASTPGWNLDGACPGRFWDSSGGEYFANWIRQNTVAPPPTPPYITIDSVPACGHGEYVAGKWLSSACSDCTRYAGGYCTNPADPRGWDQGCVDWVKANDDYPWQVCYDAVDRMSVHSECTQGTALGFYDSGCTMSVCMSNSACCNPSSSWGVACVDAANSICKGGRENPSLGRGYCGWMLGLGGGGGGGGVVLGGAVLSP